MPDQRECGSAAGLEENGSFRPEGKFHFPREEHLKGRNDIKAVFSRGRRFTCSSAGCRNGSCNSVKLFVLKNNLGINRICFTFSRGFGNAVKRNHAKRLGREAFRLLRPRLYGGYDLILLVFPETNPQIKNLRPSLSARTRQLEFLFSKAGILK